jgi:hypothetical protein
MNVNWTDAANLLDILDHIWIGLVLIAVAAVPSWFAFRNHQSIQDNSRVINDVRDQIVNGHKTAMRSDIDSVREELAAIRTELSWLRTDVDGLRNEARAGYDVMRGDITEERAARRSGDTALQKEINLLTTPDGI